MLVVVSMVVWAACQSAWRAKYGGDGVSGCWSW